MIAAYVLGGWERVALELNAYNVFVPNVWVLLAGWLLFAFSLSLLVWPARWLPPRARRWWIETQGTAPEKRPVQEGVSL